MPHLASASQNSLPPVYALPPPLPPKSEKSTSAFAFDSTDPSSPPPRRLSSHLKAPALLSLQLLSPPILAILIVLITLLITTSGAHVQVAGAKREILAGCASAQKALVALRAVPDVLEEKSRQASVEAVEMSVRGVGKALVLALTVIEALVEFLVDSYQSTYLCCFQLLIFGGLALLIGAVEEISDAVTASLAGIRTAIQASVVSANSVIQDAVSGINKVTSLVNVNLDVPQFSIPSLDQLSNVTIGTKLEAELRSLNSSLPDLTAIRDKINDLVGVPFEEMKYKIGNTTQNFTFTPSEVSGGTTSSLAAAVPATDLCSGLDLTFIDNIGRDLDKVVHVGVGLLVVAGLIAIAVLLYLEHLRYASMLERIRLFHAGHASARYDEDDLVELVQLSQQGVVGVWTWQAIHGSRRFTKDAKRRGKWFTSLVTHPLALAPLLIGLLGLVAVECQIAAARAIGDAAAASTDASVSTMSRSMSAQLTGELAARASTFSSSMNADIAAVQKVLDEDVFGEWVNTTTTTLNTTVVEFYSLLTSAVNATLGQTILAQPVNQFLFCIVGSKVEKVEEALTWIHDNAHFTLPTIPSDVFSISNSTVDALVQPIAAAAVGGGAPDDGEDQGVVGRLVASYVSSLEKARVLHVVFILLWVGVVVLGLAAIVLTARQEARDRAAPVGGRQEPALFQSFYNRLRSGRSTGRDQDREVEKCASLSDAFAAPAPAPSPAAPISTPPPTQQPEEDSAPFFDMAGSGRVDSSRFPFLARSSTRIALDGRRDDDNTPRAGTGRRSDLGHGWASKVARLFQSIKRPHHHQTERSWTEYGDGDEDGGGLDVHPGHDGTRDRALLSASFDGSASQNSTDPRTLHPFQLNPSAFRSAPPPISLASSPIIPQIYHAHARFPPPPLPSSSYHPTPVVVDNPFASPIYQTFSSAHVVPKPVVSQLRHQSIHPPSPFLHTAPAPAHSRNPFSD